MDARSSDARSSVMIVDDNKDWRTKFQDLIENQTEQASIKCFQAATYDQAMNLLEQNRTFSVAIIDICLDGYNPKNEDGYRFADQLRKNSPRTEIIFTVEKFSVDHYRHGNRYQPTHFQEKFPEGKGFSNEEFIEQVNEACKKAELCDVFVMMPFKEKYLPFYNNTVKPYIETLYPVCRRADEFYQPGIIMSNIRQYIQSSYLSIADLSEGNRNVVFEVGLAHALEKNVILITRDHELIPNMLSGMLLFEFREDQPEKLHRDLEKSVLDIQRIHYRAPYYKPKADINDPNCCVILTPRKEGGMNASRRLVLPILRAEDFECKELPQDIQNTGVLETCWKQIEQASLVIADLSGLDLDVFYLAGFAYGLKKEMIFISDTDTQDRIPFDLRNSSHVIYPRPSAEEDFRRALSNLKLPPRQKKEVHRPRTGRKSSTPKKPRADILLVTATQVECEVMLKTVKEMTGNTPQVLYHPQKLRNAYHNLGEINGDRVMMVQSEMGEFNALQTTEHSILDLRPDRVIMPGIAFGVNRETQKIGDILVAKTVGYYEPQRVNTTESGKVAYTYRGPQVTSSRTLFGLFQAIILQHNLKCAAEDKISAQYGLLLSGEKLIDNKDFRDQLCAEYPNAIGGEMEGIGIYRAANENHVDWIVIKAICDFADGLKNTGDKDKNQNIAATNAAKLVIKTLLESKK